MRLLDETQQIANGDKPKDWTFEKWMESRSLVILYGSETGTAQEVAARIGREARRYFFMPIVSAMNDFSLENLLKQTLVVFVASTTGQGDDPSNMRSFFKMMWSQRKNKHILFNLHFAVLGLGDSSYQKFNYAAKRLNNLLTLLGGQPLIKLGLGDDQHDLGPDFVINPWLKELWNKLMDLYPLPEGCKPIDSSVIMPPKYKAVFLNNIESISNGTCAEMSKSVSDRPNNTDNAHLAEVTMNTRVTADDHFQEVRLIEFDMTHSEERHKPGDVLMIQPQNLDEHVEEFLRVLELDPQQVFYLDVNDPNVTLPSLSLLPRPCTVRECVKNYLDIQAIPQRYFFELLSYFTKDETEREKFLEISSSEGQQALYDYCNRPKRSILEVLADFPHTRQNIPFEYIFDLVPSIRARPYSIASSSLALPKKAQILVAVVNYYTVLKRARLGLCTNWLARQRVGNSVPVWIKPGTLTFPDLSNEAIPPVVMIGPGTGCAPFRSYLQERVAAGLPKGVVMVFGCRSSTKDYFFKDEWEALVNKQELELYCAFSRDQEEKVYVQHIMKDNAPYFWKLIGEQKALVYFAGNAKRVPIDVHEALTYICEVGRGKGSQDAEEYMNKNLTKRYQTETWA
ncbi:hypothetical protein Pcinc_026317 [Petrolisthes cinctipes]|uniref:NADPH-dependent diflavin oxidoreductase 1 n=1 Tax=Petrolisthes cinctipes TaxID=88211 RepID=A0AAE1F6W3_PETCI|nr:hypothetical protein Pcinc_026317 [Petrolisthes cinctipes]